MLHPKGYAWESIQFKASCFFLLEQLENVHIYIISVKNYFYNDAFNFAPKQMSSIPRTFCLG